MNGIDNNNMNKDDMILEIYSLVKVLAGRLTEVEKSVSSLSEVQKASPPRTPSEFSKGLSDTDVKESLNSESHVKLREMSFGKKLESIDEHDQDDSMGLKTKRRESMLLNMAGEYSKEGVHIPFHVKHLFLKTTKPRHVISLLQGGNRIMRESGFEIKIQKNIDRKIKNWLIQANGIAETDYYDLS
jgi:hypothetical protein